MQLRVIIVATACLCLVVPPTCSTPILAKAIAAAKLKAAAAIGAGVVAKGGALVAAKGAILKGAANLIAKGIAAKGAAIKGAIAAKGALIDQTATAVHASAALASERFHAINSVVHTPQEVVYYDPYYYPAGYELVMNNFQPVPVVPQPEVYYSVPIIEKDC